MKKHISLFLCMLVLLVSACNTRAVAATKKADNTCLVVIEAVLPTDLVVPTCLETFPPPQQNAMILNFVGVAGGNKVIEEKAILGRSAKDDPHLPDAVIANGTEENLFVLSTRSKGALKDDDAFNNSNIAVIERSYAIEDAMKDEKEVQDS